MLFREELTRWIKPLRDRVNNLIRRAVIKAVDDSGLIQRVKLDLGNGDIQTKVERVQNFGFTSYPKAHAQGIVLFVNGNRDHPILIACDDGNYRPNLAEGESAVYNAFDLEIKLSADGTISLGDGTTLAPTAGVVTGECIDSFTGAPYADKSLIVKAQKL